MKRLISTIILLLVIFSFALLLHNTWFKDVGEEDAPISIEESNNTEEDTTKNGVITNSIEMKLR
jgi:hypothetical protein